MSVIVKGMRMPENCIECISSDLRTAIKCTEWTEISAGRRENERAWSCPLVEIPEKHGRLIDADAFAERIKSIIERQGYDDLTIGKFLTVGDVLNAVIADLKGMTLYGYEHTPTVIEAEGAEE